MSVEHIEVLVEELSMEVALRLLLPKMLGDASFLIHPHQGKTDLLKCLPGRLRGYAKWLPDNHRILVVVDQDKEDCRALKTRLEKLAIDAGFKTRSAAGGQTYVVVNRVAIEELEAWYFGDWQAVLNAYPKASRTIPQQASYRDCDAIQGGTWEAFERLVSRF